MLLIPMIVLGGPLRGEVFFFVTPECPISRKYAPEMERIRKDYAPKGFRFRTVIVDPLITPSAATDWAREFGIKSALQIDPHQKLARRWKVQVVPTCIVVDTHQALRYFGRIDDRFPALRAERKAAQHMDLRLALQDLIGGRPVRTPRTDPVGCALPRPE